MKVSCLTIFLGAGDCDGGDGDGGDGDAGVTDEGEERIQGGCTFFLKVFL